MHSSDGLASELKAGERSLAKPTKQQPTSRAASLSFLFDGFFFSFITIVSPRTLGFVRIVTFAKSTYVSLRSCYYDRFIFFKRSRRAYTSRP